MTMKLIGILISLCNFIANGLFCDEPSSDSDCYETDLSDYDIECPGYESCRGSSLSATNLISCGGLMSCWDAEEIVATNTAVLINIHE